MPAIRVLVLVVVTTLAVSERSLAGASPQDVAPAAAAVPRLRVRVVDDGAHPRARIPIEWRPIRDGRVAHGVMTVHTGNEGLADLGEVTALERASGGSTLGIVALEVLARDPPRLLVDLSVFRGEDVVLALPSGDRFDLRVVDSAGRPATIDGSGRAIGDTEEFDVYGVDAIRLRSRPCRSWLDRLSVSAGRLEIPFVESGLRVETSFELADGSLVDDSFDFSARDRPAIAEVRLPRPGPRIEGRFVLAPSSPIDVTRIDARVESMSGHTSVERKLAVRIGADGRFSIETGGCVDDFNTLRVCFLDSIGSSIGAWHLDYLRDAAGSLLVGDVTIADALPIVSGRVIDDAGSPVAGATLELEPDFAGRIPPELRGQPEDLRWFNSKSKGDGSFVARAPFEVARLRIRATAAGHQSARSSSVVERGDTEISVVLPRLGTVASQLLLPGSVNKDWFTARLSMTESLDAAGKEISVDPATVTTDVVRGDVESDGTLKFHDVESGVYTLWVSFRSSAGSESRRLQRIVVKPGAETTVAPIDLRFTRFPREMNVLPIVATSGAAWPLVKTWKLISVRSDGRRGASFDPDSAPDFQNGGSPLIELVAPGFRSKRFPCGDGLQVVALELGAPLTIHVVPPPRPGAGRVVIVPHAAAGELLFEEAVHSDVDAEGNAFVRIGDPGAADVYLFQRPSLEASTAEWDQVAACASALEVSESMTPREFTLEWTPR